jgi:hypothetical protein
VASFLIGESHHKMKIVATIILAFRRMPGGIRFVTGLSLVLATCLPLAVLPGGEIFINGSRVSYSEFWRSGGGLIMACLGVLGWLLFYSLIMARPWARHLAVSLGWVIVVGGIFDWQSFNVETIWALICFGLLPTWYFYFRQSVKVYFGVSDQNKIAR